MINRSIFIVALVFVAIFLNFLVVNAEEINEIAKNDLQNNKEISDSLYLYETLDDDIELKLLIEEADAIKAKFNANKSSRKTLKGNVEITEPDYDTIIFIPENMIDKVKIKDNGEIELPEELSVLEITEDNRLNSQDKRIKNVASFIAIGGMAVSRSIEKSIDGGQAKEKLFKNFKHPIAQLKDGWRADDGQFLVNNVGHPLEYFLLTNYLKASGASDLEAIVLSQITNVAWEYAVEGCYVSPSPRDLATNAAGSLAGIILYKTVLKKPVDKIYKKFGEISDKYGIDLSPQLQYNPYSKGVRMGFVVIIKH
ncbi:MAG: DUF3943 domain-containing protein [Cyanobacteriota bacterium]